MFDGPLNVHIDCKLLKIHYPNVSVLCGLEHTVSLFFNDVSKTPVANQIISAHKVIHNLFGSGMCRKPHSTFKSE